MIIFFYKYFKIKIWIEC